VKITKADVYDFLEAQGTPSRLPGLWEHQRCDSSFFDLLDEPAELLTKLGKEFSPAALAKAGVTGRDSDGAMTLSGLGPTRKYIAALRRGPDKKPFDLMTGERGSVAGHWAWRAAMADYQVEARLNEFGRQLLIAASAEDVAVLWSIGLPVAPAHGLAGFRGDRLKVFSDVLGLRAAGANSRTEGGEPPDGTHNVPFAMILVNWSPARLDLTDIPQILEVRDFLRNIKRHCAMRMDDFTVWKPSAANLERIRFCVQHGAKYEICLAMHDSIDKSCRTLDESVAGQPRRPTTYAEAVAAWAAVPESSSDGGAKKIGWELVQKLHNADVVEPLLKEAQRVADPVERAEIITFTKLVRALHLRLLQAENGLDLKETLALVDRVRESATNRRTWQRNRSLKRARSATFKPRPASSAK
jgi:hypothetical protein